MFACIFFVSWRIAFTDKSSVSIIEANSLFSFFKKDQQFKVSSIRRHLDKKDVVSEHNDPKQLH